LSVIVADLGALLVEWAENLTPAEKAEARDQLAQWCEARDTKGTKAGQ